MLKYAQDPQPPEIENAIKTINVKNLGFNSQAGDEWAKIYTLARNFEENGKLSTGKIRLHKGGILFPWGQCYLQENKQKAFRIVTLAVIEDFLDYESISFAKLCPAFQWVQNHNPIPASAIEKILQEIKNAQESQKVPTDPEAILLAINDSAFLRTIGEPIKVSMALKPMLPETELSTSWDLVANKIRDLQADFGQFKIEFLDRESFKNFCDNFSINLKDFKEICITGYFSETIRTEMEKLAKNNYYHLRLISPEFSTDGRRDKKNLDALKRLSETGVEVKFNDRLHARLLVAYNSVTKLLLLGSFDYNTECIGKERYDAGIKTKHPDLAKSAIEFFEQVWNDSGTQTLKEFIGDKK